TFFAFLMRPPNCADAQAGDTSARARAGASRCEMKRGMKKLPNESVMIRLDAGEAGTRGRRAHGRADVERRDGRATLTLLPHFAVGTLFQYPARHNDRAPGGTRRTPWLKVEEHEPAIGPAHPAWAYRPRLPMRLRMSSRFLSNVFCWSGVSTVRMSAVSFCMSSRRCARALESGGEPGVNAGICDWYCVWIESTDAF